MALQINFMFQRNSYYIITGIVNHKILLMLNTERMAWSLISSMTHLHVY